MNDLDFLNMVLEQIDDWIDILSNDELPDECQKSSHDFVAFMMARGVPKFDFEVLIGAAAALDLLPDKLGTLEGAQQFKATIIALLRESESIRE